MRAPANVSFKGETKAPTELFELKLVLSASHSASVSILQPFGQGLLTPSTPCHKLALWGLRQS